MLKGDYVNTPRFGTVRISDTFDTKEDAKENGYTEPTHYQGSHIVLGKLTRMNHMVFAAVKKSE